MVVSFWHRYLCNFGTGILYNRYFTDYYRAKTLRKADKMTRKTYTSCEVKDRWNKAHYDSITFRAGTGASEYITQLADEAGLSKAAYLRALIIADALKKGHTDAPVRLGGGGGVSRAYSDHAPQTTLDAMSAAGLI